MNRLKHIWVFSDGIIGHERQSIAIAKNLGCHISVFKCNLKGPWLFFAPFIMPTFETHVIWHNTKPDVNLKPDAIITCGRTMAAVGKYYKKQLNTKHIQILNPGDAMSNYDVMICPEHDGLTGQNLVNVTGGIHEFDDEKFAQIKSQDVCGFSDINKPIIALLAGNPNKDFYTNLPILAQQINWRFSDHHMFICGSRRTPKKQQSFFEKNFTLTQQFWFDDADGPNPYFDLLAFAELFLVTADSINMVSEVCATHQPVIIIAKSSASAKHRKYLRSIDDRLSDFDNIKNNNQPLIQIDNIVKKTLHLLQDKDS